VTFDGSSVTLDIEADRGLQLDSNGLKVGGLNSKSIDFVTDERVSLLKIAQTNTDANVGVDDGRVALEVSTAGSGEFDIAMFATASHENAFAFGAINTGNQNRALIAGKDHVANFANASDNSLFILDGVDNKFLIAVDGSQNLKFEVDSDGGITAEGNANINADLNAKMVRAESDSGPDGLFGVYDEVEGHELVSIEKGQIYAGYINVNDEMLDGDPGYTITDSSENAIASLRTSTGLVINDSSFASAALIDRTGNAKFAGVVSDIAGTGEADVLFVPGTSGLTSDNMGDAIREVAGSNFAPVQVMYKITSTDVTNGYFTLSGTPTGPENVIIWAEGGIHQNNAELIGATGASADYEMGPENEDRVYIRNGTYGTEVISDLSEELLADDIVTILYWEVA